MSKELIERLKRRIQIRNAMNADRTDPITKDMQESVTAIEALLAERDALAAELKEVREQEPVGVVDESDDGVFADLETTNGVLVKLGDKLYAHPIPVRELTDETIQRHWDEACKDTPQTPGWSRHIRFARAIERYLKGVSENG